MDRISFRRRPGNGKRPIKARIALKTATKKLKIKKALGSDGIAAEISKKKQKKMLQKNIH